ncbi:hypothetical protein HU200_031137 [Digitaria exilis]|uniref:Leucine-rich repeat-containing N-terminal plant-type domain-containing protein n=1 Tax=Digitaria exilis TaxID=1010633 RepID=A0A835EQC4_9POAL|nr:hypothetical protein HU200_031137 [Digitaria exilis]
MAFRSWNVGTDCCGWAGARCGDADGRVTSLDLGSWSLESAGLDPALFDLTYLRYLNLAWNNFNASELPSVGFERLTKLISLNLSDTNFSGQVPHSIGRVTNLVSLDLSASVEIIEMPDNFTPLVANLGGLRELHLGCVDLSESTDWCDAISMYAPNLRVLRLPFCNIYGPICGSLSALRSLSVIDLQYSFLTGPIPGFLANYSFLSVLQLSYNELEGWVPPKTFEHKKLVTIDLHHNPDLSGSLPNISADSCLQNLLIGHTKFSGTIPSSIGKIKNLKGLGLDAPNFFGNLPSSIGELKSLNTLKVSGLNLVGPIPSWITNLTSLEVLQFSQCGLYGSIPSSIGHLIKLKTFAVVQCKASGVVPPHIFNMTQLEELALGLNNFEGTGSIPANIGGLALLDVLNMSHNSFTGPIPSQLGHLSHLEALDLSYNELFGEIPSELASLNSLTTLNLSNNKLMGSIPESPHFSTFTNSSFLGNDGLCGPPLSKIFNMTQLEELFLPSNNLTGMVELNSLWRLPNLILLDLSNNKIVVLEGPDNYLMVSLPNIVLLNLASCSITKFPSILKHLNYLNGLDLSNNNMHGGIPRWVWEKWSINPNLSNNKFNSVGYETFLPICATILDLSFNLFEGSIPLPNSAQVLDYSSNMFSSMPHNFSTQLGGTYVFKASRNNLSGNIPTSFCMVAEFQVLDLSYNNLSGPLPSCMMEDANELQVLSLKNNQLRGELPHNINESCSLEILELGGNWINGQLPRSLASCKYLEVLDIQNNQIIDSFPCWISIIPRLQVLVLKSNKFFGQVESSTTVNCEFPSLRILDLSSNNLSGTLAEEWFTKLVSMMVTENNNEALVMQYDYPGAQVYQFETVLTYKGSDLTIEKVLKTLVFLDVSNNAFQGSIPATIGELVLLRELNVSHNSFIGPIPPQLDRLNILESMDLSSNELSGEIPQGLASLNFLTTLNLSDNKLVGSIPESPQFSTFSNNSFLGNDGLCGPPLSKECINTTTPKMVTHDSKKNSKDIMLFLFVGLGYGVGFAVAIVVAWGIPIRKRSRRH